MSSRLLAIVSLLLLPDSGSASFFERDLYDQSPSWDPEVGFDYAEAKERIAHPTPPDVRGRISEIEKENEED